MVQVHVATRIRPTEDPEKVRMAILELFPDAKLERRALGSDSVEASWEGHTESLTRLAEIVRDTQIPDTARGVMLRGIAGRTTRFLLGKQAALARKAAFGTESGPLGEIEVTIEAGNEEELLYAIYNVGFDTTVPFELARVPREYRPPEPEPEPADSEVRARAGARAPPTRGGTRGRARPARARGAAKGARGEAGGEGDGDVAWDDDTEDDEEGDDEDDE
ncbi:MAG: RNA-binding domain-containing protein [Thermoplasmatota archaeon]